MDEHEFVALVRARGLDAKFIGGGQRQINGGRKRVKTTVEIDTWDQPFVVYCDAAGWTVLISRPQQLDYEQRHVTGLDKALEIVLSEYRRR